MSTIINYHLKFIKTINKFLYNKKFTLTNVNLRERDMNRYSKILFRMIFGKLVNFWYSIIFSINSLEKLITLVKYTHPSQFQLLIVILHIVIM